MARKKAGAVATLKPDTVPAEPAAERTPGFLNIPERQGGVRVNEDTALTLSVLFACVKVLTEDIAKLPWNSFRKLEPRGREQDTGSDVDWVCDVQANPETPAFQWRETTVGHALTWGNGYSEIERTMTGKLAWLWQLTPDRVEPVRFRGRIIYDVANPREPNTVLEAEDVFHLRGLGFDGLVGYSPVRLAARLIGMGIAMEEFGTRFYGNDSTPGGLLKHPGKLSEPAQKNLLESWQRRHGGPTNRRTVAILEEGMDWQQTSIPPEDAQFVQSRQMTGPEICAIYRVPPHKVGILDRATFSNIENQSISYVGDGLMPWARRLEQESNIKFYGRNNRGKFFTKINLNALLRADTNARAQFYNQMADRGVFSINDILELEDRNPIGPDGDKRFVQLNMQLLEKAGEEPPEPAPTPPPPPAEEPPPAAPPAGEKAPGSDKMAALEAVCRPVLEDACGRVLKRERYQNGKGTPDDRRDYALKTLAPPARVMAEVYGTTPEMAEVALALFLNKHLATAAGGRDPDDANAAVMAGSFCEYLGRK